MTNTVSVTRELENKIVTQPTSTAAAAIARLAEHIKYSRIRIAAAYATELGVLRFNDLLSDTSQWNTSGKRFLISFDNGITQPEALLRLAEIPESEIRIPGASEALKNPNLRPKAAFHAKCYCFDAENSGKVSAEGLLIGSNNLTRAGLEMNFELAVMLNASTLQPSTVRDFDSWWNSAWTRAESLSDSLLDAYRKKRVRVAADQVANPPDGELSPTELAGADTLWIKGGFLSGGAGNQLELPQGVAQFFGFMPGARTVGESIDLQLTQGKQSWPGWLKFWGNGVWRLRLPTVHQGAPSFRGTVIRLDRGTTPNSYILRITPEDSSPAEQWVRKSQRLGRVQSTMKGGRGREYGWF